jgi:hypothetical protein
MNSDDLVDNIITNLKVIGMVKKGEKLCIRKGQLAIDSDNHLQPLRRWINKDSRDTILLHIRNTILNAIKISKGIHKDEILSDMKEWTYNRINEEMNSCEVGLQNLKTTYMNDSVIYAALDVLIERINANSSIYK